MNSNEIEEQLKDNQELIVGLDKRINDLQKQVAFNSNSPRDDYSTLFEHMELMLTQQAEVSGQLIEKINLVRQKLEQKPQPINRQIRIQLFPEHNTEFYYKIVWGRAIAWMVVMFLIFCLFLLGRGWVDGWQDQKQREYELNNYVKSWDYLYSHENKAGKKSMDKIWDRQ